MGFQGGCDPSRELHAPYLPEKHGSPFQKHWGGGGVVHTSQGPAPLPSASSRQDVCPHPALLSPFSRPPHLSFLVPRAQLLLTSSGLVMGMIQRSFCPCIYSRPPACTAVPYLS